MAAPLDVAALLKGDKESVKAGLEEAVLKELDASGSVPDSKAFLAALGAPHLGLELVGVVKSLAASFYVEFSTTSEKRWVLTPAGEEVCASCSPELAVFNAFPPAPELASKEEVEARVGAAVMRAGHGPAMKARWVAVDKATKKFRRAVEAVEGDPLRERLEAVRDGRAEMDAKEAKALKGRKMVAQQTETTYHLRRGERFRRHRVKAATDLTEDMLKEDRWEETEFKEYNFEAKGRPQEPGCLHPLMNVRREFRSILLEMGFEEMPTNNYVESSFWNFDSLFQPQAHPARDAHDTFFLSTARDARSFPPDYLERVRRTHETGGTTGSIGYRTPWSEDEARKNLLRTHTTACSARMLYALGQGEFRPKKYFSIDRVFRNESLDATHLAEFHQVEGLVADRNLTLGDLIGVIKEFFRRIGIEDVRFKPAYNPYTEPSMEIFGFSKDLGKWIEVGNSGMFRPEMLRPMGLPEDVRVIAWGLSLERPTMIKYGIADIRHMVGPKMHLDEILSAKIPRFD